MEITWELSRDGGKGGVRTGLQTSPFTPSSSYLPQPNPLYSPATFPAPTTLLIAPQGENTPQALFSFPQFPFPSTSVTRSSTLMLHSLQKSIVSSYPGQFSTSLPKALCDPSIRDPTEVNTKLEHQACQLFSQIQEFH